MRGAFADGATDLEVETVEGSRVEVDRSLEVGQQVLDGHETRAVE